MGLHWSGGVAPAAAIILTAAPSPNGHWVVPRGGVSYASNTAVGPSLYLHFRLPPQTADDGGRPTVVMCRALQRDDVKGWFGSTRCCKAECVLSVHTPAAEGEVQAVVPSPALTRAVLCGTPGFFAEGCPLLPQGAPESVRGPRPLVFDPLSGATAEPVVVQLNGRTEELPDGVVDFSMLPDPDGDDY